MTEKRWFNVPLPSSPVLPTMEAGARFRNSIKPLRRIKMENNKRVVLTLALVAVIAVAAIGIGYAYTASTTNTGNNSGAAYMTLTPTTDGTEAKWTQAYNANVTYDTLNQSTGTVYNLSQQDLKEYPEYHATGVTTINAQKIGGLILAISTVNVEDDFVIEMVNTTGTMSNKYTYKIGYSYGTTAESVTAPDGATETYKEYFIDYTPGTPVSIKGNVSDTSELVDHTTHFFKSTVRFVAVNLYVTAAEEQSTPLAAALTDVSFRFTATTSEPSNVHTVVLNVTPSNVGVTVTADKQLVAIYGDNVVLQFTPEGGNITGVSVGGNPISPVEGKYTIPLATATVIVNITVSAS